jgi:hypothetical protein
MLFWIRRLEWTSLLGDAEAGGEPWEMLRQEVSPMKPRQLRQPRVRGLLMGTGAAARQLGTSREWITQLVQEGRLPVIARDAAGRYFVDPAAVERLRQERQERAARKAAKVAGEELARVDEPQ